MSASLSGLGWRSAASTEGSYANNLVAMTGTDKDGTVVSIEIYNVTGELPGTYTPSAEGSTQLRVIRSGITYQATTGSIVVDAATWGATDGGEAVTLTGTAAASK
jgi:hypothetical protein